MIFGDDIRISARESYFHDLARCLLLTQVILGHMAGIVLPTLPELLQDPSQNAVLIAYRMLTRFGSQSAFLFVFLSGFMVAGPLLLAAKNGPPPSALAFFHKRMRRIFPVAIAALLLTAALDLTAIHGLQLKSLYQTGLGYDAIAQLTWLNFLGNIVFLEPTFVHSFGTNGPLWTLGYIVQYYFLGYALLALWAAISPQHRFWLLLLAPLLLLGMASIKAEWAVLFLSWWAGGATRLIRTPQKLAPVWLLLGLLTFIGSNVAHALVGAAASVVVGFCFANWARCASSGLSLPLGGPLKLLAAETYTVYAIHYPILVFVAATAFGSGASKTHVFFSYVATSTCAVAIAAIFIKRLTAEASRFLLRRSLHTSNSNL